MGLGILGVDEVGVVGGYDLDSMLACKLDEHGVNFFLLYVCLTVRTGTVGFVALQLDVVVIAEGLLEPYDLLLGLGGVAFGYEAGDFSAETGGAYDQPLAVGGKGFLVGSRVVIEAVGMCLRDDFDEVLVAFQVLGYDHEVTALVGLVGAVGQRAFGHIHLAAEYGFECELAFNFLHLGGKFGAELFGFAFGGFLYFLFEVGELAFVFAFDLVDIVEIFLDAEHVAVVGQRETGHAEVHCLIDKTRDRSLSVKEGILAVYVEMNELLHLQEIVS